MVVIAITVARPGQDRDKDRLRLERIKPRIVVILGRVVRLVMGRLFKIVGRLVMGRIIRIIRRLVHKNGIRLKQLVSLN